MGGDSGATGGAGSGVVPAPRGLSPQLKPPDAGAAGVEGVEAVGEAGVVDAGAAAVGGQIGAAPSPPPAPLPAVPVSGCGCSPPASACLSGFAASVLPSAVSPSAVFSSASCEPNWAESQSAASSLSRSSVMAESQVAQADGGVVGVAGRLDDLAGTGVAVDDHGDRGDLGADLEQRFDRRER